MIYSLTITDQSKPYWPSTPYLSVVVKHLGIFGFNPVGVGTVVEGMFDLPQLLTAQGQVEVQLQQQLPLLLLFLVVLQVCILDDPHCHPVLPHGSPEVVPAVVLISFLKY